MESFVLNDDKNKIMKTYSGPSALAVWPHLPEGWRIEWFTDDVSRGIVSLEDVKRFASGGPLILLERRNECTSQSQFGLTR